MNVDTLIIAARKGSAAAPPTQSAYAGAVARPAERPCTLAGQAATHSATALASAASSSLTTSFAAPYPGPTETTSRSRQVQSPYQPWVIAVADLRLETRLDLFVLQDGVYDLVRPLQDRPAQVDLEAVTLDCSRVY